MTGVTILGPVRDITVRFNTGVDVSFRVNNLRTSRIVTILGPGRGLRSYSRDELFLFLGYYSRDEIIEVLQKEQETWSRQYRDVSAWFYSQMLRSVMHIPAT